MRGGTVRFFEYALGDVVTRVDREQDVAVFVLGEEVFQLPEERVC